MNIKITGNGDVRGSGIIDVGVVPYTYSGYTYYAGGGRMSITGYGSISADIIANARMDGQAHTKGGAGTFYYKKGGAATGVVLVRSTFPATYGTSIQGPAALAAMLVDDARVTYGNKDGSKLLRVTTLDLKAGSKASITFDGQSVSLATQPTVGSGQILKVNQGSLSVAGGLEIPTSAGLDVQGNITVTGSARVSGTIDHATGTLKVTEELTWDTNDDIPTAVECRSLVVTAGSKQTIRGGVVVSENCTIAAGASVNVRGGVAAKVAEIDGTLAMFGGRMVVSGSMRVSGTLTHHETSSTHETIDLQVAGTLTLTKTGVIHANKKSTKTTGNRKYWYASHGGRASIDSDTQGEYGSLTNPVSAHQHPA